MRLGFRRAVWRRQASSRRPIDAASSVGPASTRRRVLSRGSITVEFALVLPLFLAIVFGIIDGGRLMMARWVVSYAIERGGRSASLRSTASVAAVQTVITQAGTLIGLSGSGATVLVNSGATVFASRKHGDQVKVSMTYTFNRKLAFVFPSATINMTASTLTTVE